MLNLLQLDKSFNAFNYNNRYNTRTVSLHANLQNSIFIALLYVLIYHVRAISHQKTWKKTKVLQDLTRIKVHKIYGIIVAILTNVKKKMGNQPSQSCREIMHYIFPATTKLATF